MLLDKKTLQYSNSLHEWKLISLYLIEKSFSSLMTMAPECNGHENSYF